jgi:hypothetical protein
MSPFGLPSAGYPASARWHVFHFPYTPRRLCGSADGAARLRLGASRRSAPTQGNEVGGECAAAPIENPHQRPCRPCPRMTRIHANKTMADKLLYSSPFATICVIRGQNFRFTSLAPAHVALRAAFGRLPSQRPLACVPLPLNAPAALREFGRLHQAL